MSGDADAVDQGATLGEHFNFYSMFYFYTNIEPSVALDMNLCAFILVEKLSFIIIIN